MTKPIKHPEENVVYKGPTPDIGDLSCYRPKQGLILSEWDLTIAERLAIMRGANIELGVYTEPIPPVSLAIVKRPGVDGETIEYIDEHGPFRAVEPGDLTEAQVRAGAEALGLKFAPRDDEVAYTLDPSRRTSLRTKLYGRARANDWPLWIALLLAPHKANRRIVRELMAIRKAGGDA